MAYKLSERHLQDEPRPEDYGGPINLNKVAAVFMLFGLLGLMTSCYYGMDSDQVVRSAYAPFGTNSAKVFGPLVTTEPQKTFNVNIVAPVALQKWAFVEVEVLDHNKEYLYSFGDELWYEQGRDSDGLWVESKRHYSLPIVFPDPGKYYLKVKPTGGNALPQSVSVVVNKQRGSSLPHLWFGILTLLTGIGLLWWIYQDHLEFD